jgi:hypothetical protein
VSVAWAARIAWPGSRQACHHPQCKRFTVASSVAMIGACAGEFAAGIAFPADGPLVVAAALVVAGIGLVLSCWPHPVDNTLMALIEACELAPKPASTWTAADWAAWEQELSKL